MVLKVSCKAKDAEKHKLCVSNLFFHRDKLFSAGDKGVIKIWSTELKLLKEIQAHASPICQLTASGDFLFSSSTDGVVKCWDLESFKEKIIAPDDSKLEFWNSEYIDDIIYTGDGRGHIKMLKNGKEYGTIKLDDSGITHVVFDKNLIFTAKDNGIIVTDVKLDGDNTSCYEKNKLSGKGPFAIIDDKLIFASCDGKGIIVNRIAEDQSIHEVFKKLDAHKMVINSIAAVSWDNNPRNANLFTGGEDKRVKRWQLTNEAITETESCDAEMIINSIVEGKPGSIFAAGGDGHIIRLNV